MIYLSMDSTPEKEAAMIIKTLPNLWVMWQYIYLFQTEGMEWN